MVLTFEEEDGGKDPPTIVRTTFGVGGEGGGGGLDQTWNRKRKATKQLIPSQKLGMVWRLK